MAAGPGGQSALVEDHRGAAAGASITRRDGRPAAAGIHVGCGGAPLGLLLQADMWLQRGDAGQVAATRAFNLKPNAGLTIVSIQYNDPALYSCCMHEYREKRMNG